NFTPLPAVPSAEASREPPTLVGRGMTTAPADIRNVAIIGHKGSGKTSLAEAMLYVAKATPKLGKVDDKSSILDDTIEEKEHACSLEASVSNVTWAGKKLNIV